MRFYTQSLWLRTLYPAFWILMAVSRALRMHSHPVSRLDWLWLAAYVAIAVLVSAGGWLSYYVVEADALTVWQVFRKVVVPYGQIESVAPFREKRVKAAADVIEMSVEGRKRPLFLRPTRYREFVEALEPHLNSWQFHL